MNNPQIEYPIILDEDDSGKPVRLFDAEIENHLRWESQNMLHMWEEELAGYKKTLETISVPGYRHPNPVASVEASIGYYTKRIAEVKDMIEEIKADPDDYDKHTFAAKVSAQMWLVCMAAPPSKEMVEEFDKWVREVTAEAEIIHLWNSI